jgi:[acyl-carrier-protein] S-malonyltransferase
VGEYAAYVAAGSLALADALRLVRRRGELMRQAGRERPGTMAAVLGLGRDAVEALCARIDAGTVVAANLNAPLQVVVSGDPAAVDAAMTAAREAGARKVIPLNVAGAFHSPLMESASRGLRSALSEITIRPAAIPVIANASARPVVAPEAIRESLASQLTSPVRWVECMEALLRDPGPPFVEAGPGKVLTGLLRTLDREAPCIPVGEPADLAALETA